jgi:hypothetical protein
MPERRIAAFGESGSTYPRASLAERRFAATHSRLAAHIRRILLYQQWVACSQSQCATNEYYRRPSGAFATNIPKRC